MLKRWSIGLGLAVSAVVGLSYATTYAPVLRTCPIGGEKFEGYEMMSNSYFGERPDGKPYSPTPVRPIPECPKNGFVIFDKALTPAELARLTPLIETAEYRALREAETQYYRAWWLLSRSGRNDAYLEAEFLLTASWESDEEPDRKVRYQTAFVAAASSLVRDSNNSENWFWLNLRAANALRELGRFNEAAARLDSLDREEILPRDKAPLAGARFWIDGLRGLVQKRNRASEPLALMPPRMVARQCLDGVVDPAERALCDDAEIAQAMREVSEARAASSAAAAEASEAATDAAAAASEAATDAAAAASEAAKEAQRAARRRRR